MTEDLKPQKRRRVDKTTFIMSTKECSSFFGVTQKTMNSWGNSGCPKVARGQYDLKKVFTWWLAHIHEGQMETPDDSMNSARRKYWWQKADREEIKKKVDELELMPISEIYPEWVTRMREVTNGLAALSFRLAGLLSPYLRDQSDKIKIQGLIDSEQWKLRDNYCRGGKFCPPESEGE